MGEIESQQYKDRKGMEFFSWGFIVTIGSEKNA
jgi:hypothetical protein